LPGKDDLEAQGFDFSMDFPQAILQEPENAAIGFPETLFSGIERLFSPCVRSYSKLRNRSEFFRPFDIFSFRKSNQGETLWDFIIFEDYSKMSRN